MTYTLVLEWLRHDPKARTVEEERDFRSKLSALDGAAKLLAAERQRQSKTPSIGPVLRSMRLSGPNDFCMSYAEIKDWASAPGD